MNIERMLAVANAIENETIPGLGFNMIDWTNRPFTKVGDHACGTVCCIGGWACVLFGEEGDMVYGQEAQQLLDLNNDQAKRLFLNYYDWVYPDSLEQITRAQAVAAIRRMVQEEGGLVPTPVLTVTVPVEEEVLTRKDVAGVIRTMVAEEEGWTPAPEFGPITDTPIEHTWDSPDPEVNVPLEEVEYAYAIVKR
jgi:hypothetical protein